MKPRNLLRWLLLLVVAASLGALVWQQGQKSSSPANAASDQGALRQKFLVQALYIHGNFRCETCLSIEDQAMRAITEDFAEQVLSGQLAYQAINMDKDSLSHYADDFQLTAASLVLTDGLGAAGHWKVLEKTWELVGDPVAFRDYVNRETKAFLAEVR